MFRALLLAAAFSIAHCSISHAQTIDDGYMLLRHALRTSILYSHDSWTQYWEGTRKRSNDNIGTLTTETAAWTANYGLTDRLNILTSVPYVTTHASKGVLTDMKGFQDLTLAAKYRVLEKSFTSYGTLRAMAVLSGAVPLSDYTPDFQPLSIGTASKRIAGRTTLHFQAERGWLLDASAAYTWRDNVTLDRSSYFTDGRLFLTNEVEMPSVFDYELGAGYARGAWMSSLTYAQQRTRGGGDIRRQDMPFVSNRMNFARAGAMLQYSLPGTGLQLEFAYAYTLNGRNVGQATTATAGFAYRFDFDGARAR